MAHADTVRALLRRLQAAGGLAFAILDPESEVYSWRTRLGRWPFEVQIDRYALQIRCYVGEELFCTGRINEDELVLLIEPSTGSGDAAALAELIEFVDGVVKANSRRWLRPPHADRHPDRRAEDRQSATIKALPGRTIHEPG
jgi:hypothetical protein